MINFWKHYKKPLIGLAAVILLVSSSLFWLPKFAYATLGHPTLLDSQAVAISTSTCTTASVTPAANKLLILTVVNGSGADNVAGPTSISGDSITWSSSATAAVSYQGTAGTNRKKFTVWTGVGASPTTGTISINFGVNQNTCIYSLFQYGSDVDATGTAGANGIVQNNTFTGNSSAGVVTVSLSGGFGSANNGALALFSATANTTATPKSGWNEISDVDYTAGGTQTLETQDIGTNDGTGTATWALGGSQPSGAIILEIKAAGGSPPASTNVPAFIYFQ